MPKLNDIQLAERLRKRIAELEAGVEIAAKDVRALLTDTQQQQLEAALENQSKIRALKPAKSKEQKKASGWKTKRELRIEAFKQALAELEGNELEALQKLLLKKEARRSRVYLDAFVKERSKGVSRNQAESRANDALTRAHLRRYDDVGMGIIGKRNKEMEDLEKSLLDSFKKNDDIDDS